MIYDNITLQAGIDTIEITSTTFTKNFDYFSHDSTRRLTDTEDGEPRYKYRLNPDKALIGNRTNNTLQDYQITKDFMIATAGLESTVTTRIDFKFDNFKTPYTKLYKINKLLLLLIAEKYKITNRYESIDLKTAEKKTARIQNKYMQAEFYNKAQAEPESGIQCRLELRSTALYEPDTEDITKEQRELCKWLDTLRAITEDKALFETVTNSINDHLLALYAKDYADKYTFTQYLPTVKDFIFAQKQLTDLFERNGRTKQSASLYKSRHQLQMLKRKDLMQYVTEIERAARAFLIGKAELKTA